MEGYGFKRKKYKLCIHVYTQIENPIQNIFWLDNTKQIYFLSATSTNTHYAITGKLLAALQTHCLTVYATKHGNIIFPNVLMTLSDFAISS